MDDADGVHALAQAHGEEHVADLADRRIGEYPFQIVLPERADASVQQGDRADDRDHGCRAACECVEDRIGPRDQVNAGRDHGGGVDQRRHGRRALHGVRQPGLQRELAGLAARAEQQHQPDRGGDPRLAPVMLAKTPANDVVPK